jgi:hypothetical protein
MSGRVGYIALALALSAISISQPRAASGLEKNFWLSGPRYDRVMPTCDYPRVLDGIIGDLKLGSGTPNCRSWASRISERPRCCRGRPSPFRDAFAAARR